jgi:sirohydrochlorin cobaltochelatase
MQSFKQRLAKGQVDVHHHHAEFQPESHSHSDDNAGSSHSHSHGHSHARYKHIAHPNGPRTMINENMCCCFMGQFPQHIIDEEKASKPEREGIPSCKR